MAGEGEKIEAKSCFDCVQSIESIYTGGSVAVSEDEQRLFAVCNEDISVVDVGSGRRLASLKGDTEVVTALAVKPDGAHLVAASRSMQVTVWDLATYTAVRTFRPHDAHILAMHVDASSTLVALGFTDGTVRVWDIDRGYCTHNLRGHGGLVTAVRFHPAADGPHLVSAGENGDVRIWNLARSACVAVLRAHDSAVRAIGFDAGGGVLVTGGRDSVVNVWSWARRALERTIPVYEAVEAAGVLRGSALGARVVYTGGARGVLRLWDADSGRELAAQAAELNAQHALADVVYLPRAQRLCAVTSDQNLLFYGARDAQLRRERQIVGYNEEVTALAFAAPGHLAVATNTAQLRVYALDSLDCELAYGHSDIVLALAAHDAGGVVATGAKDGTARVWAVDVRAPPTRRVTCVALAVGHTRAVGAVALAHGSDAPFMVTGSEDRTVKRWDLEPLRAVLADPARAAQLVADAGGPLRLHARFTAAAHERDVNAVRVAPGNQVFATASQDKTAKLWDAATGRALGTLQGHRRGVWAVALSPADRVAATASSDRTLKLWSLADFSCLKTLEGHTSSVLNVEFVSGGTQLLSTGSDGLVKLWSVRDGACVLTLDRHESKVWALAVQRPGEALVATGGADSAICLWRDSTQDQLQRLLRDEAQALAQQQQLDNCLLARDFRAAVALALALDQPHRLRAIFEGALAESRQPGAADSPPTTDAADTAIDSAPPILGSAAIDAAVGALAPDQLERLLKYVRSWNTNGRFARVAQAALHCVLASYPPETILALPAAKDLIAALLPYSERHFSRLDALLTGSFIVDYTLHAMDAVDADMED
ncbi:U3 small nucleolar RNA-associated protein [Coemansia sp. RSA 2711]|nr:U3 small nucleolar RNA-associated protein [Coemansia sp. RSA 2711]